MISTALSSRSVSPLGPGVPPGRGIRTIFTAACKVSSGTFANTSTEGTVPSTVDVAIQTASAKPTKVLISASVVSRANWASSGRTLGMSQCRKRRRAYQCWLQRGRRCNWFQDEPASNEPEDPATNKSSQKKPLKVHGGFSHFRPYLANIILTQNVTTPEVKTGEKSKQQESLPPNSIHPFAFTMSWFQKKMKKVVPIFKKTRHLYTDPFSSQPC